MVERMPRFPTKAALAAIALVLAWTSGSAAQTAKPGGAAAQAGGDVSQAPPGGGTPPSVMPPVRRPGPQVRVPQGSPGTPGTRFPPDGMPPGPSPHEGGTMLPMLLRSVSLTPDQDVRVRQIIGKGRMETHALMEQLRQAEDRLADQIVTSGPLKLTDVQPHLDRISQLRQQLLQDAARVSLEIRAVLTPEQQQKVDALAEAEAKKTKADDAKTGDEKAAVDAKGTKAAADAKAGEMKPKKRN